MDIVGKYGTAKIYAKTVDEIIECIKPTAKIVSHLKPIYNFKATE